MKKSLVLFLMAMLVSVTALAQSTIKGKVVDEAGEAIIGASVMIKGSSQGTVTDLDGNFTVQVQPGGGVDYILYRICHSGREGCQRHESDTERRQHHS